MGEGEEKLELEFMTPEELANYLKVNRMTVYRWISQGLIPYYELGRLKRVRRSDLETFLAGIRRQKGPKTKKRRGRPRRGERPPGSPVEQEGGPVAGPPSQPPAQAQPDAR